MWTAAARPGASMAFAVALWTLAALPVVASDRDEDVKTDSGKKKVTLCHRPPGNPANAHTISVGEPAKAAHLRHGDQLGACPDVTSRTSATPDAPAKGRRDRTPAAPSTKTDASPPPP